MMRGGSAFKLFFFISILVFIIKKRPPRQCIPHNPPYQRLSLRFPSYDRGTSTLEERKKEKKGGKKKQRNRNKDKY